jgi:hypothetical protein
MSIDYKNTSYLVLRSALICHCVMYIRGLIDRVLYAHCICVRTNISALS